MEVRKLLSRSFKPALDRRYLLTAGVVFVGYVLAAQLGLSLSDSVKQVTTVWPPSGIALVVLLVMGYRYWPAIFVGAFTANALVHEPAWVALGIAFGNTLEAVAGAVLLKEVFSFKNAFRVPRDVLVFGVASALSVVIAASLGPLWLALGGLIDWSQYGQVATTWWLGDVLGNLVFGPFLLTVISFQAARKSIRGRYVEGGLVLAVTFGLTIVVFASKSAGIISYPYLLFPLVLWAAIRFTQLGVVSTVLMIAVTAIWCTIGGLGPFVRTATNTGQALLQLQLYLVVLSATSLMVAMAITERLAAEAKLIRLDNELKEANKRVTNILAEVMDGGGKRNGKS